jgi:hypothetical protein
LERTGGELNAGVNYSQVSIWRDEQKTVIRMCESCQSSFRWTVLWEELEVL